MTQAITGNRRRYRGQSMEKRRALRREQLIAAAKEIMGGAGFNAATVRAVCRSAQLTERYFYESFDNLNELFNACYDQELARLREALITAIKAADSDPVAMARAGLEANFRFFKQDPQAARILLIEVYSTQPDMLLLYKRGVQDFADIVRVIIEQQFDLPEDSPLDPSLLSTALVGATTQLGVRWYLSGFEQPEAVMVENALVVVAAVSEKLSG